VECSDSRIAVSLKRLRFKLTNKNENLDDLRKHLNLSADEFEFLSKYTENP